MGTRCKVQLLWEGHKNVGNRPYGFEIYLVNVKTIRTLTHIFVAFSENLNIMIIALLLQKLNHLYVCTFCTWLMLTAKVHSV